MSTKHLSKLGLMIAQTLQPVINALDKSASYSNEAAADTGHEKPSTQDRSLQIILDSMIRPLHRQLTEEVKLQDGRTIPSVRGRATQSANQLIAFQSKYADDMDAMTTDPQFYNLTKWYEVNHAREDAYVELYHALTEVYEYVTRKKWVFVDLNQARVPTEDKAKADAKAILAMAMKAHTPERKLIKRGEARTTK